MPTGSWTVAIGPISARKRPMTWAEGLLFMPPTETAILEALSIVREGSQPWAGRGIDIGELGGGGREGVGGGFSEPEEGHWSPVARAVVCAVGST